MRYFEIVKPPARHIEPTLARERPPGKTTQSRDGNRWRAGHQFVASNPINRPSRRPHLSPRRSQ